MEKALSWYRVKVKLNKTGYHSIFQHHAIPFGTWLMAQGFVHMQNNEPMHTSYNSARGTLKAKWNRTNFQVMSWPLQSAN